MTTSFLVAALAVAPLSCQVSGGNVEVKLPADMNPKIHEMAVIHGKQRVVIVDDAHAFAPFPASKTLALPIKEQRAVEYRNGKAAEVKAFPEAGSYTLLFTNNLETERENMDSLECGITVSN